MSEKKISAKSMTSDEYVAVVAGGVKELESIALFDWLVSNGVVESDIIILEKGQTLDEYHAEVDRKRREIDEARRSARRPS